MGDVVDMIEAKRAMRRTARQIAAVDKVAADVITMLADPSVLNWTTSDLETLRQLVAERCVLLYPELFGDIDDTTSGTHAPATVNAGA
jgi:hypothetical protein